MSIAPHNWLDIPDAQRAMASALQFQLSQTQSWNEHELRAAQLSAISSLLKHAAKYCRFYKSSSYEVLAKTKLNTEDWLALPTLDRKAAQEAGEALRCQIDLTKGHGNLHSLRSSGSTGRPIEVQTTDRAQWWWRAITLRDHLWHARDFSQTLAVIKHHGEDVNMLPGSEGKIWGPSTATLFSSGASFGLNSSETIDNQYSWLSKISPSYLVIYPSLLNALATINNHSKSPLSFRNITTIGEILSPETRRFAENSFKCRITDIYSAQETGYLALQCPKHCHYHVQSESVYLEVLDEDGQPCKPGQTGRVVVTPLHNFATPLIRYEIGDYAVVGEPCDCGIALPVLKKIIGRQRNLVTYPDGSKNWPSYNPMKLMDILPSSQFQLIQSSTDSMTLKVATGSKSISNDKASAAKQTIIDAMGAHFDIKIKCVDKIPRAKSGKYEEFISELESQ